MVIDISEHVAGPVLPALIARMDVQDPHLLIEIRIGSARGTRMEKAGCVHRADVAVKVDPRSLASTRLLGWR